MIPCSCGKLYVGVIGCSFKTRIHGHVIDIKDNHTHSFAMAEHSDNMKDHICIDDAKVITQYDH